MNLCSRFGPRLSCVLPRGQAFHFARPLTPAFSTFPFTVVIKTKVGAAAAVTYIMFTGR